MFITRPHSLTRVGPHLPAARQRRHGAAKCDRKVRRTDHTPFTATTLERTIWRVLIVCNTLRTERWRPKYGLLVSGPKDSIQVNTAPHLPPMNVTIFERTST
jgi:hypothetical protein